MINFNPNQTFELIEKNKDNPDFLILDVRTKREFLDTRIENSINIDILSMDFEDHIKRLDTSKTYLIYCRSGSRSIPAISVLQAHGFQGYHMAGGLIVWNFSDLPTVSGWVSRRSMVELKQ